MRVETWRVVMAGVCLCALAVAMSAEDDSPDDSGGRTVRGLVALYDFASDSGPVVHDRSGAGTPVDLQIADMNAVRRSAGSLEVTGDTVIRSEQPPTRIIEAIRTSGEITIEAWVQPATANQQGPARIVTLSKDPNERNFTLGQDGDRFDVRLRTTETSTNGLPSLSTKNQTLQAKLTHVVYTREPSGRTNIYLDGGRQTEAAVAGGTSNWVDQFHLALANELTGDRPWRGTYHLVAIYSRALSPQEVTRNFNAGPQSRGGGGTEQATSAARSGRGLVALYDFASDSGPLVSDRSGVSPPVNLRIADMNAVRRSAGSLEVTGDTVIRSEHPPARIIEAIRRSEEITLEAWVRPAKTDQQGPARIVTLSKNTGERNVTLGQEGDTFDVRLRTTTTSTNGIPSLSTKDKTLKARRMHVVYTRDRAGNARIYLDGKVRAEGKVEGATSNWDGAYDLALANEGGGERPWRGTYELVAIYSRALRPQEVQRHFQAGPAAQTSAEQVASSPGPQEQFFRDHVAPLFAQHCLDCHDRVVKKGGLDLSRKAAALAGGDSGPVLIAGNAEQSLLWNRVHDDEMPQDQPPLSPEEKQALRQWIDEGAAWSLDVIDPALYASGTRPPENFLRRLTVPEYIATVRAAVGVDIAKEARDLLPRDLRADGFNNTAYNLGVDLEHVEAYSQLAEMIVSRMDVKEYAARFSQSRLLSTDDTMRQFIADMGKWILRGPLDDREVTSYSGIATTVASSGGDFDEAVRYLVEAMLQSPRFLYRVERQIGDGNPVPAGPYELASRLSYLLWGGPPDEALLRAADDGTLFDPAVLEEHTRRMLADRRAVAHSKQFIAQWLNLDGLRNLAPNPNRFPDWSPELAADMRAESLAYFEEVVWKQNRPLSDLFNAQVTFLTPRLARHYGITPHENGDTRYDLSQVSGRGGLLTQGSVLTVGGDEASMVTRGLFVLHDLLRGAVKDPPPCVDTTPVPTKPGLTQRAIAEARIANSACGGCHSRFEPLAFGLEKFDGLGAWHEADEHGNPLREDGSILIPGTGEVVPYQTSAELMELLAESDRVKETITWKLTQFALGRPLTASDAPIVARIHESARQAGGTYAALMRAIVTSDLVQSTRTEAQP